MREEHALSAMMQNEKARPMKMLPRIEDALRYAGLRKTTQMLKMATAKPIHANAMAVRASLRVWRIQSMSFITLVT